MKKKHFQKLMEYISCNDIWLVLIESTCAYTCDKFKVKIVPRDQAFQNIEFCALLFLHFWKANLFVVLVWNVVIFWILHKERCFGFATYVWLIVWLNGFSSNSVKTIIQSCSSCNKPSPRIWPLSISHGFFNYITYNPLYMCKFP